MFFSSTTCALYNTRSCDSRRNGSLNPASVVSGAALTANCSSMAATTFTSTCVPILDGKEIFPQRGAEFRGGGQLTINAGRNTINLQECDHYRLKLP